MTSHTPLKDEEISGGPFMAAGGAVLQSFAPSSPLYLDVDLINAENAGSDWRCDVVETMEGLEALEADWRMLESSGARDIHAFQGFDWCAEWARVCLGQGRGCEGPFIIVVRRRGRVKLIWPLMMTKAGPIRVLRWLSDPFSQYGDVLADLSGTDLTRAMEEAWAAILAHGGADLVRLRHVRVDANAADFLARRFHRAGDAEGAPWLDLRRFPDEEAYEKRYSKTQRRRRKRIRKALEGHGKLEFSLLSGKGAVHAAIDSIIREKRIWLEQRGLYSKPLASARLADFLRALPAGGNGDAGLVISEMRVGGRAVSWELGLRYKGRHYGYITAHLHELTNASPGRLHMDLSQRQAIRDGMKVFDLLVPAAEHKRAWSNAVTEVNDYYRPLSLKGLIYGAGYLKVARPLLRKAYCAAPPRWRRMLGLSRLGG